MSDSISAYYDDLEAKEAEELAARQRTPEYWRDRAQKAEKRLEEIHRSVSLLGGFLKNPPRFEPVFRQENET